MIRACNDDTCISGSTTCNGNLCVLLNDGFIVPNNGKGVIIEEGQSGAVDVLWLGRDTCGPTDLDLTIVAVGGGGFLNGGGGGSGYLNYYLLGEITPGFYQYMAYTGLFTFSYMFTLGLKNALLAYMTSLENTKVLNLKDNGFNVLSCLFTSFCFYTN